MTSSILYFTFLFLSLSLLFQFLPPTGRGFFQTSTLHWPISLALLFAATLLFGITPLLPAVFLSLANAMLVTGLFSLGLLVMALDKSDPRWGLPWLAAGLALVTVVFETLIRQGDNTFLIRVMLVACGVSAGAVFLVVAVARYRFRPRSWQLYLMCFFAVSCALLMVKRAEMLYLSGPMAVGSLKNEAGDSLGLRWMASLCVYMCYFMMHNHLGERLQIATEQQRERAEDALFSTLRSMAVARNTQTQKHMGRLQQLVGQTARALQRNPALRSPVTDAEVALMTRACVLHDIGMMLLPDSLLSKSGHLSQPERLEMQQHTLLGARVLYAADVTQPDRSSQGMAQTLEVAMQIAASHHERWDGSGYPKGLAGESIPLPARVVAVADTFDTYLSSRVYTDIWSFDEAIMAIEKQAGTAFDPLVVQAFLSDIDAIARITTLHRD